MKKKENKRRSVMSPETDCLPEVVDTRPEISPYAGSTVELHLSDGIKYTIPSSILHRSPKLYSPSSWYRTVQLETTGDVGHIFVHYLFTGTYQCLKPKGSSPDGKLAAEFTTSVRVYALAREYELPPLEGLAKREIERLGDRLRVSTVLDLVRIGYPHPSADDEWFSNYLKSVLSSVFQNPSELLDCGIPNPERQTLSVSDVLFKSLAELVRDRTIQSRDLNTAAQDGASEDSAFVRPGRELGSPREAALDVDELDMPATCEPDLFLDAAANPFEPVSNGPSLEAEPQPEHEPAMEPEPEPAMELEPELAVERENEMVFGTRRKERGKKGKKGKMKKNKTTEVEGVILSTPEEAAQSEEAEAALVVTEDWPICGHDGESKLESVCHGRVNHVFGDGWKDCSSCQDFIRQRFYQLAV